MDKWLSKEHTAALNLMPVEYELCASLSWLSNLRWIAGLSVIAATWLVDTSWMCISTPTSDTYWNRNSCIQHSFLALVNQNPMRPFRDKFHSAYSGMDANCSGLDRNDFTYPLFRRDRKSGDYCIFSCIQSWQPSSYLQQKLLLLLLYPHY